MTTKTKLVTAEEFWELAAGNKYLELVRGEVRELTPVNGPHGQLQARIASMFERYADETGGAVGVETGFILERDPDMVRGPDVYYVRPERASLVDAERGFCAGAPDIAVEILSPDDRAVDVQDKVQEYLRAGTEAVWVVNRRARSITVYLADGTARVYRFGETIDGGELFPGLSVPLDQVFRTRRAAGAG